MKRYSASLIIRGNANQNNEISAHTCQNGYYQKVYKQQMLAKMWKKGNPCTLLVGMWIGTATVENSTEVPQKTKNRTTIWSSNSTPRYISGENENTNLKRYIHPHVHTALFTIQDMVATQIAINRWMDKDDVISIFNTMEYYSAVIKEWNPAICSMNRPREYCA